MKFHPLTLDALLGALTFLGLARLRERPGWVNAVWLGLALGGCALSRPIFLLFVPLMFWWLLVKEEVGARVPLVVMSLLVATLIAAPWVIRNFSIHRSFVLGRSNFGYMLWLGNNPAASGSLWIDRKSTVADRIPEELKARLGTARDELSQDALFRAEAVAYIAGDVYGAAARWAKKFFYFWFKSLNSIAVPEQSGGREEEW